MRNKIIIQTVFKILNNSGLDYCVQNKYEMMPEEIPSDIDMFYRNANENELDFIVNKIAKDTGLLITQKIPNGYFQFAYMLSHLLPNKDFQLQLDFYPELSSKKFPHCYLPSEMLNNKRFYNGFYVPDYYDEIYYQITRRIMKKDMSIEHINNIKEKLGDRLEIKDRLLVAFGDILYKLITKMLDSNDPSYFYDNYDLFYTYLNKISKKNSSVEKWIYQKKFELLIVFPQRILNPCGMSIVFIAPDGGGKSTVIEEIKKTCAASFHGIEYKYFRPRLFKNPGHYNAINPTEEAKDNPDPHGRPLNSFPKSLFRFLFYNFDFFLGNLLIIYPFKLKRKLVIFDRYYYDYYVDMRRYQYNLPKWFPSLFSFMIPSPDLTFILDAPGQVLYNRKQELSVKELDRQRTNYLKLGKTIKNAHIIDSTQPIDKVIEDITKLVILKKTNQTSKKIKG